MCILSVVHSSLTIQKYMLGGDDFSNRMCLNESGGIRLVVLSWLLFCVGCTIYTPLGLSFCVAAGLFLGLW